jgi:hypothetical protein
MKPDAERAFRWLDKNPSHELSCNWWGDEPKWEVHRVPGGRNDREWKRVGTGETALAAVLDAMEKKP